MFVILTRTNPCLFVAHTLPENAHCLVFDCLPDGYRKACEWIKTNHATIGDGPLYRAVYPCVEGNDPVMDLSDYDRLAHPRPPYKGTVESWEDGTMKISYVEVVRDISIDTLVEWMEDEERQQTSAYPPLSSSPFHAEKGGGGRTLSNLWACGFCSERSLYYPSVFTGLTNIQQYMVDECSSHKRTVQELLSLTSIHFRVDMGIILEQYDALTIGNRPWISTPSIARSAVVFPSSFSSFSHGGEKGGKNLLPTLVMNGAFPISYEHVFDYFYERIAQGRLITFTSHIAYKQGQHTYPAPSCAPHTFTFNSSTNTWRSTLMPVTPGSSALILPYGISLSAMKECCRERKLGGVDFTHMGMYHTDKTKKVPSISRDIPAYDAYTITCMDPDTPHTVKVYANMQEYVNAWQAEKLKDIIRQKEADRFARNCRKHERQLLRKIHVISKVEDYHGNIIRYFVDEGLAEKRLRLELDFGEEYVDHLWNVPIHKLDKSAWINDECDSDDDDGDLQDDDNDEERARKKIRYDPTQNISARDIWARQLLTHHK